MATNLEKFFGSAEKIAHMEIQTFPNIKIIQYGDPLDENHGDAQGAQPILFEKKFEDEENFKEFLNAETTEDEDS